MIKVILIGGLQAEHIAKNLDDNMFEVVKTYNFVADFFEDFVNNQSYYDFDKLLLVQTGITEDSETLPIDQIRDVQEALIFIDSSAYFYAVIKDVELYKEIQANQNERLVYPATNILYFNKINYKTMDNVLEGQYDRKGIYHPDFNQGVDVETESDIEEIEDEEDIEIKHFEEPEDLEPEEPEYEEEEDLEPEEPKKKFNLLGKLKQRKEREVYQGNQEDELPIDFFEGILLVTGDRQSGVSTTAANLASLYSKNDYTTILIDFDLIRRNQVNLFPKAYELSERDKRLKEGLFFGLNNPRGAEEVLAVLNESLGLLFSYDSGRYDQHIGNKRVAELLTEKRVTALLGFLKSKFDVVILDMPFDQLVKLNAIVSYVDRVVLCTKNTIQSLDNLLYVELEKLKDHEVEYATLLAKSMLVLANYNYDYKYDKKEFTKERVEGILQEIGNSMFELNVAGFIPYDETYDNQLLDGNLIVDQSKDYEMCFIQIANNLKR